MRTLYPIKRTFRDLLTPAVISREEQALDINLATDLNELLQTDTGEQLDADLVAFQPPVIEPEPDPGTVGEQPLDSILRTNLDEQIETDIGELIEIVVAALLETDLGENLETNLNQPLQV